MPEVQVRKNNVGKYRDGYGWSQAKLACLAEVDRSLISRIERYGYEPTNRIKRSIASALGVSVNDVWPIDV